LRNEFIKTKDDKEAKKMWKESIYAKLANKHTAIKQYAIK